MALFLYVCLGGAAGTGLRYVVGLATAGALGGFPLGTLLVNLAGSFLIAMVMVLGADKGWLTTPARVVLCTGVMGGFTTYSSFNFETMRLWQAGAHGQSLLNVGLTLGGCLVMGALGLGAGRLLSGGP